MPRRSLRIVHLEDDANDAALVAQILRAAGLSSRIAVVDTREQFVETINEQHVDVVLADYSLPSFDGLTALNLVRESHPFLPFILLSGSLGEELAVDALKSGATDFVLKSRLSRLVPAVRRAMREVEDRGARYEAEQALRRSETLLQTLVESLAEGVMACAPDGRLLHWNRAALQLHGLSDLGGREQIEEFRPLLELLSLDGRPLPFEEWPVSKVLRGEVLRDFETRVRHTDGSWERILVYGGSLIPDAEDHPIMAILTMMDITERKEAEQALQHVNRSLVDRNTEIQNFYHTLSHELKTPLTSAREFLSIVADGLAGPLSTSQEEFLGIAIESCDQMRFYVNDLLDVTRIETGKLSLELQPARIEQLVTRAVETLKPMAAGKNLTLSCEVARGLPVITLDQHRVLQVLTNLTTNAIKFTDAGGRIHVTVAESPDDPTCVQVSVRDTGRGIPRDELDLIFTRLYQANRDHLSAESQSGLGLGLYICREVIQKHGGRIWVESESDRGSVFSFTLPKEQSHPALA